MFTVICWMFGGIGFILEFSIPYHRDFLVHAVESGRKIH